MERLKHPFGHEWHVSINKYSDKTKVEETEYPSFMYNAKTMADEVPRMIVLFKLEREDTLRKTHKQCSHQEAVPVEDNHLTCCLGVKCKECPQLLSLEKIEHCTPEDIDTAKAWTCASHISSKGGDLMGEGYLITVDDRMFWDNIYQNLSQTP